MRKPHAAVLLVLLPLSLWTAGQAVAPGSVKARWPIKTSLQAGVDIAAAAPLLSLADFLALAPAAEHMSTEFESALFPKTAGAKFADGELVRTQGYVRLVAGEPDGDFHIQLSETNDTFDNSLVVEVPKDDAAFVTDAPVRGAATTVRNFVIARLKTGDPTGRVVHIVGPAYVEVTGQLFFDAEHKAAMAKNVYRGKSINGKQLPSKTSWEVHPIVKMIFVAAPR